MKVDSKANGLYSPALPQQKASVTSEKTVTNAENPPTTANSLEAIRARTAGINTQRYSRQVVITGQSQATDAVKVVRLTAEQQAKVMQGLLYGPFPQTSIKK